MREKCKYQLSRFKVKSSNDGRSRQKKPLRVPLEKNAIEKCRSKRMLAKSSVTRNANRVGELIAVMGSRTKLRQFGDGIVEARNKARALTKELNELYPASIESDGAWLLEVKENAREVLGEIEDYRRVPMMLLLGCLVKMFA